MITREQVLQEAKLYLRITTWSPTSDTAVFKADDPSHTFISAFAATRPDGAKAEYNTFPYVFGGFDTRSSFLQRVSGGTAPGGWDREKGKPTTHWYRNPPKSLGYGSTVPRKLAGIDCSGFVSRTWGLKAKESTGSLPAKLLEIRKEQLQPGDCVNKAGDHVRLFAGWKGAKMVCYEAVGGAPGGEYKGQERGSVVFHAINWDDRYTPMTPFPLLKSMSPAPGCYRGSVHNLQAQIVGSGQLDVLRVLVDGQEVKAVMRSVAVAGVGGCEVSCQGAWTQGKHTVQILARNSVMKQTFQDELTWEFEVW